MSNISFGKAQSKNGYTIIPILYDGLNDEEIKDCIKMLQLHFPPELSDLIYSYANERKPLRIQTPKFYIPFGLK
jgi:hypothetical protein